MSRAGASKSKIEKSSKTANAPSTINTPVAHYDIVPGTSFTDRDWCNLVERESNESFIGDIVDEILTEVDKAVYASYVDKMLVPYAVAKARDAVVQMFEWLTLARDEGQADFFCALIDGEPHPAITDSLAQGSVPTVLVTCRTSASITEECDNQAESPCVTPTECQCQQELGEEVVTNFTQDEEGSRILDQPIDFSNLVQNENCLPDMPTAATPSDVKFDDTCGADEETEANSKEFIHPEEVETQAMCVMSEQDSCRPAAAAFEWPRQSMNQVRNSTILNKQSMILKKILPHKLPIDRVDTVYSIVSPPDHPKPTTRRLSHSVKNTEKLHQHTSLGSAVLPPALIDSISLTEGVTVRQLSRIKKLPHKHGSKTDAMSEALQRGLHTINGFTNCEDVSKLFESHIQVIKPIGYQSPIPPIGISSTVGSQ